MTGRDTFLKLLRDDILKLDLAELDFGIYRVLRHRRAEIEAFLNERLPALIGEALGGAARDRREGVRQRLATLRDDLEQASKPLGLDTAFPNGELAGQLKPFPKGEEYLKLTEESRYLEARAGLSASEEDRLYNALYVFFARYYRDGDFITQPRRGKDARYSVPYGGEDVHFHWKSRGSHYVKTTETLTTYAFEHHGQRVVFTLAAAAEEQNNVKGKTRYFLPQVKEARVVKETGEYVVPFVFRPLTEAEEKQWGNGAKSRRDDADDADIAPNGATTQERIVEDALAALQPPPGLPRDVLRHHLRRYTRKARTDYFVHPALGAFLRAEFDYYLKNEFLDVEAFTDEAAFGDRLLKFRALRRIGRELIALLDQIESFQARLFEKRKFVLRADYLLPIRLLPRDLWPAVLANDAQHAAWRDLFALDGPVTEETLRTHPTLVVDTRHFDEAFTLAALAAFEDRDAATDGLLVHAENYAALRTLEPTFRGKVKVIYIDPPYNTGNDGFLYKDDFSRHSTWLSMMEERLRLGREMLAEDGAIFVSIGDNEQANLKTLLDVVFEPDNFIADVIWQKVFAPKNTAQHFSDDHEYVVVYAKDAATWRPNLLPRSAEADERYTNLDDDPRGLWASSDLTARNYYSEGQYEVTSPSGRSFSPPSGRYWVVSRENFLQLDKERRIWWGANGNNMPRRKRFLSDVKQGIVPQTLWTHEDVGHTQDAKKELLSIVSFERTEDVLNTVKPTDLIRRVLQVGTAEDETAYVVDFFAGSGTTAHAVMRQNSLDGGQRKFVLVEMGEYFDSMVFQRAVRAMYAPNWKDGKPVEEPAIQALPLNVAAGISEDLPEWMERSPRLVKVLRLESYEDSLNALELPVERDARLKGQQALYGDDYLLRYLLPVETEGSAPLLNTAALERPFDYRLRVQTPEGPREEPVDLVETANLLLGLHVRRVHALADGGRRYRVVEALEADRPVLVVWRDVTGDFDPARERAFLEGQFVLDDYATIYTNADSALPRGRSLDALLKERMLERDRGAW